MEKLFPSNAALVHTSCHRGIVSDIYFVLRVSKEPEAARHSELTQPFTPGHKKPVNKKPQPINSKSMNLCLYANPRQLKASLQLKHKEISTIDKIDWTTGINLHLLLISTEHKLMGLQFCRLMPLMMYSLGFLR